MQIIRDLAASAIADPELHRLVSDVFLRVSDCPEVLGFVLIVEPGDTIASIDAILRFSILADRHEFILEHVDWFELVYVLGQDGYGVEVYLPKDIDLPELLAMCVTQALPVEPTP